MTKIYETPVYVGYGNSGQFDQVKKAKGEWMARTVELFTFGPRKVSRWQPATPADLARVGIYEEDRA